MGLECRVVPCCSSLGRSVVLCFLVLLLLCVFACSVEMFGL